MNYICRHKNDGVIAQSVEQRTENPCVPGSIPGDTTEKKSSYFRNCFFLIYCFLEYFISKKNATNKPIPPKTNRDAAYTIPAMS